MLVNSRDAIFVPKTGCDTCPDGRPMCVLLWVRCKMYTFSGRVSNLVCASSAAPDVFDTVLN